LEAQQNLYIKFPVQLEQWMMEGAYNKVFKAKASVPSESYYFFMDLLMETVRNEIADCIDKAYNQLAISELQKMLALKDLNETQLFIAERKWKIKNFDLVDCIVPEREESLHSKSGIPAMKIMGQTLQYARELERIV